jgi:hypothetical protein
MALGKISHALEGVKKFKSVVAALYERLNFSRIRRKKPFVKRCYNSFFTPSYAWQSKEKVEPDL